MTTETYLYLSPHLDDAVLSAGGLMAAQLAVGNRVVVATICTADPLADAAFSPLAMQMHRQWGDPDRPYERRRHEDIAACRALDGAEPRHLGLLDAIYRGNPQATGSRYETFQELFGPIPAWDYPFANAVASAIGDLVTELDPTLIFAPLGVGTNVDHQHARNAALSITGGQRVRLYEDQPYSTGLYPVVSADPVTLALRDGAISARPVTHAIEWATKRRSIECYQSQLTGIFGHDYAGLAALEAYSRSIGGSKVHMERLWDPDAS